MSRPGLTVVVVGGGIIGVASAVHLVRAGCRVTLLTEAALHSGASGRSLAWLNSAATYGEAYHRLRLVGIDRYRTLAAARPEVDWLRFDGGLRWRAADQAEQLRSEHDHQRAIGYDSHLVGPDEVAALVPGVAPRAVPGTGALWNPGEGWVDLPSLIGQLVREYLERGGDLRIHAGRSTPLVAGGTVTGVRTATGETYPADAVLLATGTGVPAAVAELGATIPDATSLAFLVTTAPFRHGLRAVLNTPRASLRPEPGGGLAVDADWTVADIEARPNGGYAMPPATVQSLLAEASRLLVDRPRLEVAWAGTGVKPIPGDGLPVLGRLEAVAGLHVAFTHSGATLGLVAGELLAAEIVSGDPHPLLAEFTPQRFRAPA